jgi:vacuolar-type H+-ATPase subunit C/Vma6
MKDNSISITVEAYPESSLSYKKRIKISEQRIKTITNVLTEDYKIPKSNIKTVIVKKAVKKPAVKITISTAG